MSLVLLMLRGILDKLLFFRTPLGAERVIAKAAGGKRLRPGTVNNEIPLDNRQVI